ncbi:MAG: Lysine--tRNA ligase [Alphaproteobacteria bacterium MarineAlpha5_Bin9]|nr:MAG: Lysine--tRNA ligase [Alphaproteobacteria bacterium MarineAlpha5_Bin9]|tara:strand:- start:188 stop:1756 length:1569 start_codon:yes stop_codon:yes gene_type:complete
MNINNEIINNLKSWPFGEAKKIINNINNDTNKQIIFQTGYGPSGLPHIGTFGEVVRTTMIKKAYDYLIGNNKSKIITFSDDMDGLRKVPENIPNQKLIEKYIDIPLTSIPDPFNKFESFGHHNNAKLRSFLDDFGFEYEFLSSTNEYKSGRFDQTLKLMLENHEKILELILPTLRAERRKTYSPFLPISNISGKVLKVKIDEYQPKNNSIIYKEPENGKLTEILVTGGNCKLQWKVDWAMRWISLGINYEMCGKDLSESVILGKQICKILNKEPPINLIYEMFLDEKGEKISKSIGNGISVEEWLRYATQESLSLFMFQKPKTAKKLFFDVIPKSVDEYFSYLKKFNNTQNKIEKLDNPVWHIHSGSVPKIDTDITFGLIMNLVNACNSQDPSVIWEFLKEYDKNLNKNDKYLNSLITSSINYYIDFVLPTKKYKKINDENIKIFKDIIIYLRKIDNSTSSKEIQTQIYEIGKNNFTNLREYFKLIYSVLFGQEQGPRLGSFIKIYGIGKTIDLIEHAIKLK